MVRELGRLPLGTNYETAAKEIASVVHNVNCADYDHPPRLVIDSTGVGDPVVDSLQRFLPTSVTATRVWWTSGSKRRRVGREMHVGKGWLVSRLQALIDTHRVEVPDTPEAQMLLEELMSFEVRITDHGAVVASAKGNAHDDLVMSLALCVLEDSSPAPSYRPLPPSPYRSQIEEDFEYLHRAPPTLW